MVLDLSPGFSLDRETSCRGMNGKGPGRHGLATLIQQLSMARKQGSEVNSLGPQLISYDLLAPLMKSLTSLDKSNHPPHSLNPDNGTTHA
ncbi:hypothetical protein VFPPC_01471 [Pochonia chlamydosporia 170]|uniref:Uncharacterized protein n=1 Tax=Pochonia chlamydosporia 170 TaxID=1380566 RepID=A0A179G906_METCM|nr:hypothetical protein VFPPC_01471 [Pochonia chlamydosporia 170]OAQ73863.1 hypothetical protein VFPPC_01471 [Pochonia chlamydosporia 170]